MTWSGFLGWSSGVEGGGKEGKHESVVSGVSWEQHGRLKEDLHRMFKSGESTHSSTHSAVQSPCHSSSSASTSSSSAVLAAAVGRQRGGGLCVRGDWQQQNGCMGEGRKRKAGSPLSSSSCISQ
uniref:Uncharacterized protein n=1 Tax=Chromera velia CCMP2878 TaxID=1169474 RepID=A0A0G4HWL3_9ALVE|eukprot:Cvel_9072.t1-p1 / transcript=Cvel_9072.t1 / gene=Cvel_9072 / organism=Chromera_velia_CCMP2878 / gene_product=hypothetical protein / transcript_product=hypothetical protein / location=Cvel_scaffold514:70950-71318(-) / protein_length=123 / sequence_SO=supercontig / SO=protein_coding / is_pseudo=false